MMTLPVLVIIEMKLATCPTVLSKAFSGVTFEMSRNAILALSKTVD